MTTFTSGLNLAQLLQGLQAVDAGHQQVEQHQVGLQAFLYPLHRFFAGGGGFALCSRPLPARSGCSAASLVRHPPAEFWPFAHSLFPLAGAADSWLERDEEGKLAACSRLALHPDFAAHGMHQAAGNGQSQSHSLGLAFVPGQAKKVVENLNVILGGIPGPVSETLILTEFGTVHCSAAAVRLRLRGLTWRSRRSHM